MRGAFVLADVVATDEELDRELDEKTEGEAAALVTVAPRQEVGLREVDSRGNRESAGGLRARDWPGEGIREARSCWRTPRRPTRSWTRRRRVRRRRW